MFNRLMEFFKFKYVFNTDKQEFLVYLNKEGVFCIKLILL